uniref:ArnT family glycosyltransferase n=1 Tax=Gluconobacter thailandicus TaxID=257438 RepID=UPI000AE8C856|nr:glycosyltransferase family 39 protein [Gluconobacter thailandicus]
MPAVKVRTREMFWAFLAVLTAIRLTLAAILPLTPDEAYYWVWSRHLQMGYFDHPFMVALWIKIGTWIVGDTPLGVRFLGPLSVLPGSWALFHAARLLLPSRPWPLSGFQAVLLLNATLMLGLGAATMTPDTPLVFFVSLALYAIGKAVSQPASRALGWWLLAGMLLGLAFDSKYTAVLIGLGLGGAVVFSPALRKQPGPWLAIPVLLAATVPVLYWNATHHWASLLKQGGRAGDWHPARAVQFLSELLGGQIGLATPLIFGLFVMGLWACFKRNRLLGWLGTLPLAVFIFHAFGDRVQANWPAVVYPVLALAAIEAGRRIRWAAISGLVVTALVYVQAAFAPLPLPPAKDPVQRQTGGWPEFSQKLGERAVAQGATVFMAEDYGLASQLAFNQSHLDVLGTDRRWSLFRLPVVQTNRGIQVEEIHHIPSPLPADVLCRESHGQTVRCYRMTVVENPLGVQLPRHS